MINYTFINTETNEVFSQSMKISERTKFLEENPHIKQTLCAPGMVDPYRIGVTKNSSDFKERVRDIQRLYPKSRIDFR